MAHDDDGGLVFWQGHCDVNDVMNTESLIFLPKVKIDGKMVVADKAPWNKRAPKLNCSSGHARAQLDCSTICGI